MYILLKFIYFYNKCFKSHSWVITDFGGLGMSKKEIKKQITEHIYKHNLIGGDNKYIEGFLKLSPKTKPINILFIIINCNNIVHDVISYLHTL